MDERQEYLDVERHVETGKWHLTKYELLTDALGTKSSRRIGIDATPYSSVREAELAASVKYKGLPFGDELL